MQNYRLFIVIFLVLLTACASTNKTVLPTTSISPTETSFPILTSTPIPTLTPTLKPAPTATVTPTSIPLVNLEGTLFFDYNGSGLREENEPPIANFDVCAKAKDICVTTDENGHYTFRSIAPEGANIYLTFVDPNANNPVLAFGYINLWKKEVIIPAYKVNGVNMPEQHLNDTDIFPIDQSILTIPGKTNQTGLMQGFLTLPFSASDSGLIYCVGAHDHDPREGYFTNYKGTKDKNWGNCANVNTGDTHEGIDYFVPEGTFILAPISGFLTHEFINKDAYNARVLRLENSSVINRPGYYLVLVFGHHSVPLVENIPIEWIGRGPKVYRGQIIALSGKTGTFNKPHLHMGYCGNSLPGQPADFKCWDPFGIEFDPNNVGFPTDILDEMNAWTIYNNPVSPYYKRPQ